MVLIIKTGNEMQQTKYYIIECPTVTFAAVPPGKLCVSCQGELIHIPLRTQCTQEMSLMQTSVVNMLLYCSTSARITYSSALL